MTDPSEVKRLAAHDKLHDLGFRREEDWFTRGNGNDADWECIHIDTVAAIAALAQRNAGEEVIRQMWPGPGNCVIVRELDRFRLLEPGTKLYAAPPASPPGWVLVPVEPTEAMWDAGRDPVMYRDMNHYRPKDSPVPAWQIGPSGKVETDTSKGTTAVHVWRAMLAAAPTSPVEGSKP